METSYIGQYQVEREIGRGGMAIVYLARQENLDRHVALKVLADHLVFDGQFVQRFANEAKIAAHLNHPGIVKIYDIGSVNGKHFISMEYLEGKPLSEILRASGPLPAERAINIMRQVADALDYAHKKGVIHRDIKPSNILVGAGDKVTLTDFGIARAASQSHLTMTGMYMGTPAYMSPEQAAGKSTDHRSDLYALGILLHAMLTGMVPYDSETPLSTLNLHISAEIPPLRQKRPDVPRWLEAVYYNAMAKDPAQRYQSGAELVRDLDAKGVGMKPVRVPVPIKPPPTPPSPEEKRIRRSRAIKLVIGGIALNLVVLLVLLLSNLHLGALFGTGSGGGGSTSGESVAASAPSASTNMSAQPQSQPPLLAVSSPSPDPADSLSAQLAATPSPVRMTGALEITTAPPKAHIRLNGNYIGISPLTLPGLEVKRYTVAASKDGYVGTSLGVTVWADKTRPVTLTLKQQAHTPTPPPSYGGSITVTNPPSYQPRPPSSRPRYEAPRPIRVVEPPPPEPAPEPASTVAAPKPDEF